MKINVWTVLALLSFGIFLFILFRLKPGKSPKNQRIVSGVLGLMMGVIGYYEMLTGSSPLVLIRYILILLPVLGGLLLILSAFQPRLQNNIFEYLGWALMASWISPLLLSWTSIQVQWVSSLVIVLVALIMQIMERKSLPNWNSSRAARK